MKQPASRAVRDGARFYQKEYGYLPARGYEFVTAEEAFLGWQIDVRKADLFMRILYTRGEDYVSFRTAAQPPDEFVDLQIVIYAATGEHLRIEGNDSKVLPKYLDRVEAYFAGEYHRNPDGLRAAEQAYRDLLPKVEAEPVMPVEAAVSREPKRIAILYYPLLAIVLLLLCGALTTLYMVLLERLLSALSLDPDAYGLLMGGGAVLLAIGTLLLIWGLRRKS